MRNDLQDLDGGDVRHELPLTEAGAETSPGGCADGSCGCSHHGYISDKKRYLARLKRIEGQVRGVQRMIDDEKYCIDILTQISAMTSALESVALGLLDEHLNHCVLHAAQQGGDEADLKIQEASRAIARLVRS